MTEVGVVKRTWFAMGTEWEIALTGSQTEEYLQLVSESVQQEVERLEEQLSFYRPSSEISEINSRAAFEEVTLDPRLFTLLEQARDLSEMTHGAFDPTVAPLLRCWGFVGGSGSMPGVREIEQARAVVGMQHVLLNPANQSVRYDREGVQLELGAIGKGYAVECIVEMLRDYEIENALLHGGTSTICGLGSSGEGDGWKIALRRPYSETDEILTTFTLKNEALSVSAPHGKWFSQDGMRYGHVLDPRTGYPVAGNVLAAVITESATESDALSTALLTLGPDWIPELRALRPTSKLLVATHEEDGGLNLIFDPVIEK